MADDIGFATSLRSSAPSRVQRQLPPRAWNETPEHFAFMRRKMLEAANNYRTAHGRFEPYGQGAASGFARRMRRGFLADALTYRNRLRETQA